MPNRMGSTAKLPQQFGAGPRFSECRGMTPLFRRTSSLANPYLFAVVLPNRTAKSGVVSPHSSRTSQHAGESCVLHLVLPVAMSGNQQDLPHLSAGSKIRILVDEDHQIDRLSDERMLG